MRTIPSKAIHYIKNNIKTATFISLSHTLMNLESCEFTDALGAKKPILLPFSAMMVKHQHEQNAHQLVDATIAAVRTKYWIPRIRSLVRKVSHACERCRIFMCDEELARKM